MQAGCGVLRQETCGAIGGEQGRGCHGRATGERGCHGGGMTVRGYFVRCTAWHGNRLKGRQDRRERQFRPWWTRRQWLQLAGQTRSMLDALDAFRNACPHQGRQVASTDRCPHWRLTANTAEFDSIRIDWVMGLQYSRNSQDGGCWWHGTTGTPPPELC